MILSSVLFSLLHECGHLAAMLWFDCKPQEIRFAAFGMEIRRAAGIRMSYRQEMLVLLAGPAINLILAVIFTLGGVFFQAGLPDTAVVNLILGAFNLLPVSGTDGGQALYCALARHLSERGTHWLCSGISFVFLCCLYTLVFFLTLRGRFPFSLLGVLVYLTVMTLLRLPASQ